MTKPGLTLLATVLISDGLGSVHVFSVFIETLERGLAASRAEVSLMTRILPRKTSNRTSRIAALRLNGGNQYNTNFTNC